MISSSSRAVLATVLLLLAGLINPVLAVTVRINALGDSITGSPGCWRATLWQMLQTAGITNTAFVGSLPAQGCGFPYDGANDGHGGALATGIANQNQLPGWLAISQPDIVMMELGTNDVWNNLSPQVILAAFTTLVGQMRAQKPTMRILVAQITPMAPSNCATCPQGVINLNAAIPGWAASISTAASPVSVVDCFTGYNDATDTVDGVHPNDSGNAKLANCWFTPLKNAIIAASGGAIPTTLPPSSTSSKSTVSSTSSKPAISSTLSTSTIKTSSSTTASSTKTATSSTGTGAVQVEWGQCGGQGWSGPTACVSGTKCVYSNTWYSQCLPS